MKRGRRAKHELHYFVKSQFRTFSQENSLSGDSCVGCFAASRVCLICIGYIQVPIPRRLPIIQLHRSSRVFGV